MPKRGIPAHTMLKFFKQVEDIRVSKVAQFELKKVLEELSERIAKKSLLYARHARRRTVLPEDIELAIKELFLKS